MSRSGIERVIYADDMVMLCRDAQEALPPANPSRVDSPSRAGLELHPQKMKIVDMGHPYYECHIIPACGMALMLNGDHGMHRI
jgi:hypothetical protein